MAVCVGCGASFAGTAPGTPGRRRELCDECQVASVRWEQIAVCPACGARRATTGVRASDPSAARNPDGTWTKPCVGCAVLGERAVRDARRLLADRGWLAAAYGDASAAEIARALGVSDQTVHNWLGRHEIPKRSRSEVLARRYATARGAGSGRNRQMVTGGDRGAKRVEPSVMRDG